MAEQFVLDASVALAWFLPESESASLYAAGVARILSNEHAICVVPGLFHVEVAATLIRRRRQRGSGFGKRKFETAIERLANLRIHTDLTYYRADRVAQIAQSYHVQGYDALYLDLAVRLELPIASIDRGLISAARRQNVECLAVPKRSLERLRSS